MGNYIIKSEIPAPKGRGSPNELGRRNQKSPPQRGEARPMNLGGEINKGFTLMELMVSIGLMTLIMGIIAMIFSQGSSTYRDTRERLWIYNAASVSLDFLVTDLNGCLPVEEGKQLFSIGEDEPGAGDNNSRDWISFKAAVPISGGIRTGEVSYRLFPDNDPSILTESGKPLAQTTRTKRPLYVLRREVKDSEGKILSRSDLCHYIISFNVEYYDRTSHSFRQTTDLATPRDSFIWPIGDNNPEGEMLHSGLRVTIIVVASGGEHQERLISKTVWLPLGQ